MSEITPRITLEHLELPPANAPLTTTYSTNDPLEIVQWDDSILSAACEPVAVEEFGYGLWTLGKRMLKTIGDNGIGLAGPQAGIAKRIFVMKCKDGTEIIAANPKVLPYGSNDVHPEGCLSFRGQGGKSIYGDVTRKTNVTFLYYEPLEGKEVQVELEGVDAFCAQHEADHLDGIMFFSPLRMKNHYRKKVLKEWEKGKR